MRIEDVTKLDWQKDKNLLAVQHKLAALVDRETQDRARLAELEHIVRDAEESLVQCRVAQLLSENADEPAEVIHERLASSRRNIADLQANIEALKLARTRLEPAVTAATSEAKLRVVQMLLGPYREVTESLRAMLEKAAELNRIIHAIHTLTVKQNLMGAIYGNPVLKPLSLLPAFNFLTVPNGADAGEFQYWKRYVDKIFVND